MLSKIFGFISGHKFITLIVVLAVVAGGYYTYGKLTSTTGEVKYVLTAVEKGTITSSVSGSGQVSVSQQLDVKAKAAGDIVLIGVKKGQEVKSGAVLVQLDDNDAKKTVRDAGINLESAKLALKKLKKPADKLSILQAETALAQAKRDLEDLKKPADPLELLQAENALSQAIESKQKAEDTLTKSYDEGFNDITDAFLDLPTVMIGLEDMFFDMTISKDFKNIDWYVNQVAADTVATASSYKGDLSRALDKARTSYDKNLTNYKSSSRTSGTSTIESLILETYDATKVMADAVKAANNYVDFVQSDIALRNGTLPTIISTHQGLIDTYTGNTNSHLVTLLAMKRTIQDGKEDIANAERSVTEKTEALNDLKNGADENDLKTAEEKVKEKEESLAEIKAPPDPLDIKTQELSVKQKENALADAKENLADYYVRAPFSGIVAKMDMKKGDSVSSGGVIATMITHQRIAEISLNEVDVAKIKAGQKVILTFDAVPDLSLSGEVTDVDSIGTVSQGVVSYTVKTTFDTQDERVKPSMSVSANIITDVKTDALIVPNSAVKLQGEENYVQIADGQNLQAQNGSLKGVALLTPPRRQIVEIGISNDESTEIISGLKEGDLVVTGIINSQAGTATSNSNQNSMFRIPGMGGGPPPGQDFGRR